MDRDAPPEGSSVGPEAARSSIVDSRGPRRVALGVTGSIAAYKSAELVRQLTTAGVEVQVLMTPDARRFITPLTLGTVSGREVLVEIFPDDENSGTWTRHVELGLWADLFVVAPASATTISKLATGLCDSMLTAAALSRRCPMIVFPAMDHDMWHHPATRRNVATLRADGVEVVDPEHGELASGLIGAGRLPEPETIAAVIRERLARRDQLADRHVLVTAGPTREAIDPVRFVSNGSTGTMGFALAAAAAQRGARVTLVAGPVELPTPGGVERVDVVSAQDMHDAAMEHAGADLVIGVAAVSDYRPAEYAEQKMKKGEGTLQLTLERTPDVITAIAAQKRLGQTVVGFALETNDGEAHAREKLERKGLDWIALNYAGREDSGFGTGANTITLLSSSGETIELPPMPKQALADLILDHVVVGQA